MSAFVSGIAFAVITASASVISVGPGAFPVSATPITFNGLADGTEVNGLVSGGVLFGYSLGNGAIVIDGGPGATNNVALPNIVSLGDPTGTLTLALPAFSDTFGYGFAVLSTVPLANATTINLFSGATNVGTLSFASAPDPIFDGGFAGIQSTIPFNRVALTFTTAAPAFAVDNIRFASTAVPGVPEPSGLLLTLGGAAALLAWGSSKRRLRH